MTVIRVPAQAHRGFTQSVSPMIRSRANKIRIRVESVLRLDPAASMFRQLVQAGVGVALDYTIQGHEPFTYVVGEDDEDSILHIDPAFSWIAHDETEAKLTAFMVKQRQLWREEILRSPVRLGGARTNPIYHAYLDSVAWKLFRFYAIAMVGGRCEHCGKDRQAGEVLQVHHSTYTRFGREDSDDVEVLCVPCHTKADTERYRDAQDRGLDTWASKVYGNDWQSTEDEDEVRQEFEDWKKHKNRGY